MHKVVLSPQPGTALIKSHRDSLQCSGGITPLTKRCQGSNCIVPMQHHHSTYIQQLRGSLKRQVPGQRLPSNLEIGSLFGTERTHHDMRTLAPLNLCRPTFERRVMSDSQATTPCTKIPSAYRSMQRACDVRPESNPVHVRVLNDCNDLFADLSSIGRQLDDLIPADYLAFSPYNLREPWSICPDIR